MFLLSTAGLYTLPLSLIAQYTNEIANVVNTTTRLDLDSSSHVTLCCIELVSQGEKPSTISVVLTVIRVQPDSYIDRVKGRRDVISPDRVWITFTEFGGYFSV